MNLRLPLCRGDGVGLLNMWEHFEQGDGQEFDYMINTFEPFKRHRRSRKKNLSNKALQKIRNKQRLWKLYRTTGNNDDYIIKYKEALNATTKEIIYSKRMFEQTNASVYILGKPTLKRTI